MAGFGEPRVTGNAVLLSGFLGGALLVQKSPYKIVDITADKALMIVENEVSGNRFAVTVTQISGRE